MFKLEDTHTDFKRKFSVIWLFWSLIMQCQRFLLFSSPFCCSQLFIYPNFCMWSLFVIISHIIMEARLEHTLDFPPRICGVLSYFLWWGFQSIPLVAKQSLFWQSFLEVVSTFTSFRNNKGYIEHKLFQFSFLFQIIKYELQKNYIFTSVFTWNYKIE